MVLASPLNLSLSMMLHQLLILVTYLQLYCVLSTADTSVDRTCLH